MFGRKQKERRDSAGNTATDRNSKFLRFFRNTNFTVGVLQLSNNFDGAVWTKAARKIAALGAATLVLAGALTSTKPALATAAGLTFYPSVDVYSKGNFHFDSDTFFDKKVGNGSAFSSIGLAYGIGPDKDGAFGRSELGFDVITNTGSIVGSNFGDRLQLNGKTQLYNNDKSQTRVVAGFWGLGSKKSFAPNVIYVTGAKTFDFGRVHIGVAQSLQQKAIVGNDRTNLTLGYDKVFGGGKFQFTADYYTGKTAYSVFAPGLIYYMNDKSDFQLGYLRFNDRTLRDQIYLGFDYNFGGAAPAPTTTAPPAPETSTTAPAVN